MLGDELRLGLLHAAPCTVQDFLRFMTTILDHLLPQNWKIIIADTYYVFSFSWFQSVAGIDNLLYCTYLKYFPVRVYLYFLVVDILSRQLVCLNRGIFRTED